MYKKSERIRRAEEFLKEKLDSGKFFKEHEADKLYRLEHSYRVANIGRRIAESEGFDTEAITVACLLHDVSYCLTFRDREDYVNHGRYSARIARELISKLDFDEITTRDMLYGIAIHVDEKADFDGERTPFALTVGEADNIDRFDAYRIYETLQYKDYNTLSAREKEAHVDSVLKNLDRYKSERYSTKTAQAMWEERIGFYEAFYTRLKEQIKNGNEIF